MASPPGTVTLPRRSPRSSRTGACSTSTRWWWCRTRRCTSHRSQRWLRVFFGAFLPDHPDVTSHADLARVADIIALPEAQPAVFAGEAAPPAASLFSSAPLLAVEDLDRQAVKSLFGAKLRHEEHADNGELLAFFHGTGAHVVLRAKELRVLRPHGHILRTGRHQVPDESALTSTVWMAGVFHSMVTQGHVSINRYLSTTHSYLGLFRSHGLRVFVEQAGEWRLLHVPSAFEMSPDECRWIYLHAKGEIQLRAEARNEPQRLTLVIDVTVGAECRFLVSQHVALNGDDGAVRAPVSWTRDAAGIRVTAAPGGEIAARFPDGAFRITPGVTTLLEHVGGDELLFPDGRSRDEPFLCIVTGAARSATFTLQGELIAEAGGVLRLPQEQQLLPTVQASVTGVHARALTQVTEILPWFAHDAFVHYLSPRGLEQYSGGGWGTRDVCQGPVELLLALGRHAPIRILLGGVFRQQNAGWRLAAMVHVLRTRAATSGPATRTATSCSGRWLRWRSISTRQGDATILDEPVRFFDGDDAQAGEELSLWQHVQRAGADRQACDSRYRAGGLRPWRLERLAATRGSGFSRAAVQRVDRDAAFPDAQGTRRSVGKASVVPRMPAPLASAAQAVLADFQRLLLIDGVLAGYAHFATDQLESEQGVRYLLHPRDNTTGVHYSALAMIHAILEDLFTPDQARAHLRPASRSNSAGPMAYASSIVRCRITAASSASSSARKPRRTSAARSASCTCMRTCVTRRRWRTWETRGLLRGAVRVNPIGVRALVPTATLRQSNCYYSSSDAAFEDRYQASAAYDSVRDGKIALDGGWRVYSSGAGIATGLIIRRFLGLDVQASVLRLDPVIHRSWMGYASAPR